MIGHRYRAVILIYADFRHELEMSRYVMYEILGLSLENKRLHENLDRDLELELYSATPNFRRRP